MDNSGHRIYADWMGANMQQLSIDMPADMVTDINGDVFGMCIDIGGCRYSTATMTRRR